jgi:hypothetical protein
MFSKNCRSSIEIENKVPFHIIDFRLTLIINGSPKPKGMVIITFPPSLY